MSGTSRGTRLEAETIGGGADSVYASVNYSLRAGTEVENLYANAGATGLRLNGNELANHLFGGAGNDRLDGGGSDTMAGRQGDDSYYIDNAADVVTEAVNKGTDTIYAGVSYALAAGSEIESLRANAGATGLTLTGNGFANELLGNGGIDTLNGGGGNDRLDGQGGADIMAGGTGDDNYYVDSLSDIVTDAIGQGSDTAYASIDYALQAGSEIETIRNSGTSGLTLTGNKLANHLYGSTGKDTLNGGDGNDILTGANGKDILTGEVEAIVSMVVAVKTASSTPPLPTRA